MMSARIPIAPNSSWNNDGVARIPIAHNLSWGVTRLTWKDWLKVSEASFRVERAQRVLVGCLCEAGSWSNPSLTPWINGFWDLCSRKVRKAAEGFMGFWLASLRSWKLKQSLFYHLGLFGLEVWGFESWEGAHGVWWGAGLWRKMIFNYSLFWIEAKCD